MIHIKYGCKDNEKIQGTRINQRKKMPQVEIVLNLVDDPTLLVTSASVDLGSKQAVVEGDFSPEDVCKAVEETGFSCSLL